MKSNFLHMDVISILRRVWAQINQKRRLQIFFLIILMISSSFAEAFSLGAVLPFLGVLLSPDKIYNNGYARPFVEALEINSGDELLLPISFLFVAVIIVALILRLLLVWATGRLIFSMGADFGLNIYRRTIYQQFSVHIGRNSSEVISGMSEKAKGLIYNALMPALTALNSLIMGIFIFSMLMFISPIYTMFVFVGGILIYSGVIFLVGLRLRKESQILAKQSTNMLKAVQEGLGGIRDIIINGAQEHCIKIFTNADIPIRRAQSIIYFATLYPRIIVEASGISLMVLFAYFLSQKEGGLSAAIPIIGVLALGVQRMLPVLQQAYGAWVSMQSMVNSVSAALDLLEQPLSIYTPGNVAKVLTFEKDIRVENLWFRYSDNLPWVLKNININILKGERVGFIGTTGSGKSTLLDVLMGLLSASQGNIRVDGVLVDATQVSAWQLNLAQVPQFIYLSDSSVAENIAFGMPLEKIDMGRVRDVARMAEIADMIEALPLGYQTLVGERGTRLSGGQRQRLGIARALYKRASVIIFDEATSALDNDTEAAVMRAVQAIDADVTILMIAHRLTTLANCTRIVELDQGEIRRIGSYAEIVQGRKHER